MARLRDPRMMLKAAINAFTSGDLGAAESTCREILKASRKDVEAISLLGQIANRKGLHDEAAKLFRQCLTIAPKFVTGHVLLGQVFLRQGKEREAMARFDRALKLEPGHPPALGAKADAHILGGRRDKARALLEPEVRAGRGGTALAVILAEVELQSGAPERAIEIGREHIDRPGVPGGLRYRLGSVLGKALERTGAYDDAFAAYAKGNGGVGVKFNPTQHGQLIDGLIEAYSPERLAALPRGAVDSPLPVFVVGMPRCGSTLVEQILDSHREVFGAGEIDLVYRLIETLNWDIGSTLPYPACIEDLDQADLDRLGAAHVEALRGLGGDASRVTDKNLWNYLHVGLIALILPGAKVIHCRRDPLDTCISCFAEALPPSQHPYATDLASIGLVYREYERLMEHWRTGLDLEILEVRYEDVVADQETFSRRIVDFCGLEWDDACLRFHETKRRALTLSYDQVRRPIYRSSLGRGARFEAHLGPLVTALAGEDG